MVEGGYGATVGETGPEKPDVLIVPAARIYDLVPVRELPYGSAAPSLHQRPDRWQHPTTCQPSSKNRLHLAGRPQMSTRPSVMGPMRSSPPCDRHAAELTLLSVVDAKAATLCLLEGAVSLSR